MPVFVNKVYFCIVYGYFWLLYGPLIKFANPCTKISFIVKIPKTSNKTLPDTSLLSSTTTPPLPYECTLKKNLVLVIITPSFTQLTAIKLFQYFWWNYRTLPESKPPSCCDPELSFSSLSWAFISPWKLGVPQISMLIPLIFSTL